jgi:hypothetical protein
VRWQGPLTLWFDGKYGEKYKILVTSGSVEKKIFSLFLTLRLWGKNYFKKSFNPRS